LTRASPEALFARTDQVREALTGDRGDNQPVLSKYRQMTVGRVALVVAAAVAATACGSQADSSTTTMRAQASHRCRLYTHCGIEWAKIDGTFWRAKHPLSGASGNPPAGWGNPVQTGMLVLISPTKARFESPAGSVTFERTSRRQPPEICS
jgi:hypothetical protein